MSAQPMPRPDWFTIKDLTGGALFHRKMYGPFLVRNQAEVTMLCERLGLDPTAYKMGEASPADLATGQIAADYCKPTSAYQLPPEVVESLRRRDRLNDALVKLRHDMDLLVSYEVPTSEAEADALDVLIGELDHWQVLLQELRDGYEDPRYIKPKEDDDE